MSTALTVTEAQSAMAICIAFLNASDSESGFETPLTTCSTRIAATVFTVGECVGILAATVGLKDGTDKVGSRDGDSEEEFRIGPALKSKNVGSAIVDPPAKTTEVNAKPRPSTTEDDP
jgi:hypothetical protein